MTLVPPVLVTVSDDVWVFPTVTVPKLKLVGFDPSTPGDMPVPERGIVSVEFEAVDATVTLPLALPAEAGVKVTLKLALWPVGRVVGVVIPLTLYPLPLAAT